MSEKIYVVVGRVKWDLDCEYQIVGAYRKKEKAKQIREGLENGDLDKYEYEIIEELDIFELWETELI